MTTRSAADTAPATGDSMLLALALARRLIARDTEGIASILSDPNIATADVCVSLAALPRLTLEAEGKDPAAWLQRLTLRYATKPHGGTR